MSPLKCWAAKSAAQISNLHST